VEELKKKVDNFDEWETSLNALRSKVKEAYNLGKAINVNHIEMYIRTSTNSDALNSIGIGNDEILTIDEAIDAISVRTGNLIHFRNAFCEIKNSIFERSVEFEFF
jgi:hypothetical protein